MTDSFCRVLIESLIVSDSVTDSVLYRLEIFPKPLGNAAKTA